jgi:polar amino acid transport system substrate-binding protein
MNAPKRLHLASAVVCAALFAGCTAAVPSQGLDVPATTTTQPPATTSTAPPPDVDCGNPVQSFDPLAPMPTPGAMPDGSYMKTIADRGKLVVGVSADTLQFGARNPLNGQIEGFDIDMLHAVANAIFGDPDAIEYRVITYAQRIPSLQSAAVDIVAHTMTINCKRWGVISFSSEYFSAGQKVLVRSDSTATGIDDLDGKKICAPKGSTNIDNLAAYPKVVPYPVDDITDCLVAFQQGIVDGITGDDTVLVGFEAQDPYAKVIGDRFTDEPYGLGIAKEHPEFVAFVNGVLEQVRSDGRWADSYRRWVSTENVPAPPVAVYGRTP